MKIRHQWMHVSRREFNKVGDKSEPGFPRMFPKFSSVLVRLIRARETHDERSCVGCAQLGRLRTYHHMQKYIYIYSSYIVLTSTGCVAGIGTSSCISGYAQLRFQNCDIHSINRPSPKTLRDVLVNLCDLQIFKIDLRFLITETRLYNCIGSITSVLKCSKYRSLGLRNLSTKPDFRRWKMGSDSQLLAWLQ